MLAPRMNAELQARRSRGLWRDFGTDLGVGDGESTVRWREGGRLVAVHAQRATWSGLAACSKDDGACTVAGEKPCH